MMWGHHNRDIFLSFKVGLNQMIPFDLGIPWYQYRHKSAQNETMKQMSELEI